MTARRTPKPVFVVVNGVTYDIRDHDIEIRRDVLLSGHLDRKIAVWIDGAVVYHDEQAGRIVDAPDSLTIVFP